MPADALVLATHNEHKLREFRRLLEPLGSTLEPLPDAVELPPESGSTFAENAMLKARAAAAVTEHGVIADDSGIGAEALDGAPGVYSARYAGPGATDEQNLRKLLDEAPSGSRLEYVCALVYIEPGTRDEHTFTGTCTGRLAGTPRGSGGFGYDPAFIPDDEPTGDRTMAELSDDEKDVISHRGRAARELVAWLSR
jgi:XTP/dITP diphosphohydrolase